VVSAECRPRTFEIAWASHRYRFKFHAECRRCALSFTLLVVGMVGVPDESNLENAGRRLFEEVETLGSDLILQERYARGISAGPCQTGDQPKLMRVGAHDENNGNGLRCLGGNRADLPADSEQNVGLQTHQFRGEFGQPLRPALCVAIFDQKILPLDVAKVMQAAKSRSVSANSLGVTLPKAY
jgi:hypothetical protein